MGKGGSADSSGMYEAMASAQAAQESYALGLQQLDWAKSVWNQEQPLIDQAEQAQINVSNADLVSLKDQQAFANEQEAIYNQYYAPLEEQFVGQAENWASPSNTALVTGQARAGVSSAVQQGLNTAKEQLQAYGVRPNDPRYAGLYIGANTMGAAAEAGAGTTAAQNLKLQQLGLEEGAINTGRGVAGSTSTMTNAATGAGQGSVQGASGAAGTAQSNLSTGSSAMTAPVNWFNTGATNMGVYTNAVNAFNTTNLGYSQVNANMMSSLGSGIGDILGLFKVAKGGPVGYADGGAVDGEDSRIVSPVRSRSYPPLPPSRPLTLPRMDDRRDLPTPMTRPQLFPPTIHGPNGDYEASPFGYAEGQMMPSRWSETGLTDQANAARPPAPPQALAYPGDAQNVASTFQSAQRPPILTSTNMPPPGSEVPVNPQLPVQLRNQMNLAPSTAMAQGGPAQQPVMGIPPGGTPGGPIPTHASPSMGARTDDVDAKLTAGEFVIPKDVAQWKGHEHFVKQIDKAREEHQQFKGRGDIGGEPARGIPQRPTFVSRPSPINIPQRRFG